MIKTRPEVNQESLYNQGEVAAALQIDRHTVAKYERLGDIKFRARKTGGEKVTNGQAVIKCWEKVYL